MIAEMPKGRQSNNAPAKTEDINSDRTWFGRLLRHSKMVSMFFVTFVLAVVANVFAIPSNIGQTCDSKTMAHNFSWLCGMFAENGKKTSDAVRPSRDGLQSNDDVDTYRQGLSEAVNNAEWKPSANTDKAVRSAFQAQNTTPRSENDARLIERAHVCLDRLAASDRRLARIVHDATQQEEGKSLNYDEISNDLATLNSYDQQRLNEDGYRSSMEAISQAAALSRWSREGLNAKNKMHVTVFIEISSDYALNYIRDRILSELRNKISFTDRSEAALLIKIEGGQQQIYGHDGPVSLASTNIVVSANWANGQSCFSESISGKGRGSPAEADRASIDDAATEAAALIESNQAACPPQ